MISVENNGVGKFIVKGEHITLRAITLKTCTDNHDTLVCESKKYMFRGKIEETEGNIFILENAPENKASVFIVPAPDCVVPSIKIENGVAYINTFTYPVSIGSCRICDAERLCRDWYRLIYKTKGLHAMSNTWGDRNGRSRVNDEFIRREIDSGVDLGLDVVQIDDGWQKGIPETYEEDGLRVFEGDFWSLKEDIFPNGIRPLSEYAKEKGVELGLWFAPHSRELFKHFERDIEILKKAYSEWDIRYFKLDMLQLITQEHCERMLDFLDTLFEDCDGVSVELDVTADKRLGYLMSAAYGTIFVENRYTAWSNYYPHRTLRNLWSLSRFIPTSKFQFELVNPELYTDKYDKNDLLRPELYDVDYLFASVMLSNPLFWMETQFLSDNCREKLKKIIPIWRKYRGTLSVADVYPIAEEPSGVSMTGFVANTSDEVHILLFRECTDRESFTYDLGLGVCDLELVLSNSGVEYSLDGNLLTVNFGKMRSYAWLTGKRK